MALSSRLQGLHQVAKKAMTIGFPPLEIVSVCTLFPPMSLRTTWGRRSCALAAKLTSNKQKDKNNLFISLIYNVRAKVRQNGETAKRRPENTRLFSVTRAPGERLCPPSAVPLGCSLPCVKSVTCSVSAFSVAKIFPRRGDATPKEWRCSSMGMEIFFHGRGVFRERHQKAGRSLLFGRATQ